MVSISRDFKWQQSCKISTGILTSHKSIYRGKTPHNILLAELQWTMAMGTNVKKWIWWHHSAHVGLTFGLCQMSGSKNIIKAFTLWHAGLWIYYYCNVMIVCCRHQWTCGLVDQQFQLFVEQIVEWMKTIRYLHITAYLRQQSISPQTFVGNP